MMRSWNRLAAGSFFALLVAACAALSGQGEHDTVPILNGVALGDVQKLTTGVNLSGKHRPIVALALGSGGMRGYAHIGVLQALDETGIKPDIVVGTSIGAIVGAPYAAGMTPTQLWQMAESTNVYSFADYTLSGPGFVKGKALARWIDGLVGHVSIERFPTRFAAVASDLNRAEAIVLTNGDAGQVARASAAIPGVFLPVPYEGGELVDGGVMSVVPVRAARALGADVVIGVDIYCHGPRYSTTSLLSSVFRVTQAQSCMIARDEMAEADELIAPAVSPAGTDDPAGGERARQSGYEAARSVALQLKALVAYQP